MAVERWERYGFLAGPVFAVLIFVSALVPGQPPDNEASGEEILKFFTDKSTALQIAGLLGAAATIFGLWWVASMWRAMTKAEFGKPNLSLITALGFVLGGTFAGVGGGLWTAGSLMSDELTPELARFAFVASSVIFGVGAFAFAASTLAAAVLTIRTGFLPRWTGYLGAAVGAAFLVSGISAGSTASWLVIPLVASFLGWLTWITAVSILAWQSAGEMVDIRSSGVTDVAQQAKTLKRSRKQSVVG